MMSAPGLKVRCLASTRIAALRETGRDRQDGGELDATKERGNGDSLAGGRQSDDCVENTQHEDDDSLDRERVATPEPPGSSESSAESDVESDASAASSGTSKSGRSVVSTSCFQEAQLSPDGTCIFTSDYNRTFSVYPIGTDILEASETRPLKAYAQFGSADPIWAFAANPLFNLQDPTSTHVLVSRRDRYITLHNALWDMSGANSDPTSQTSPVDIHTPLASYKLINHLNEAVTAPLSLAYSLSGTHFFAGGQNSIALFDLTHPDSPIHTIPTIPSKRNKLKGGGRGFKGYISALSVAPSASSSEGLFAAGARTRHIGIYDSTSGISVTHFALPGTVLGRKLRTPTTAHTMGDGVSGLKWSPCARYLYVAERHSDALLIYDVRNFSLALAHCAGRAALTKQKLGFDVWNAGAADGLGCVAHEVWAGGADGKVRVWKDPYRKEGAVEADKVVDVCEGDPLPVVSTLVHASGCLAVAARGALQLDGGAGGEEGIRRGGGTRPRFSERGSLDILGLSSY